MTNSRAHCRWRSTLVTILAPAALAVSARALANNDGIYLECPCELRSDGTAFTVSAGVRSFRDTPSGPLRVVMRTVGHHVDGTDLQGYPSDFGGVPVSNSLPAQGRIAPAVLRPPGRMTIDLPLAQAQITIASATDPGTDEVPDDPESKPGDSTIDILVFYSQGFPELYDGDATTRIAHVVSLTNETYRENNVGIRLRRVGVDPRARPRFRQWTFGGTEVGRHVAVVTGPRCPEPAGHRLSSATMSRAVQSRAKGLRPRVGERGYAFVLSGAALATLDAEDGNSDRFIELEPLGQPAATSREPRTCCPVSIWPGLDPNPSLASRLDGEGGDRGS